MYYVLMYGRPQRSDEGADTKFLEMSAACRFTKTEYRAREICGDNSVDEITVSLPPIAGNTIPRLQRGYCGNKSGV